MIDTDHKPPTRDELADIDERARVAADNAAQTEANCPFDHDNLVRRNRWMRSFNRQRRNVNRWA